MLQSAYLFYKKNPLELSIIWILMLTLLPVFFSMKTLKLEDLYKLKISVVMHYAVHHRGYDYLSRRLCIHSNNHNYNTRNSNLFVLPRYKLSKSQRSVLYFGIKLSNSLLSPYFHLSLSMFKNAIRNHFVSLYSN